MHLSKAVDAAAAQPSDKLSVSSLLVSIVCVRLVCIVLSCIRVFILRSSTAVGPQCPCSCASFVNSILDQSFYFIITNYDDNEFATTRHCLSSGEEKSEFLVNVAEAREARASVRQLRYTRSNSTVKLQ